MLGLSQISMVECLKCQRSWSLETEEIGFLQKNKENLHTELTCKWCGYEFSYIDGIIQEMISNNSFSEQNFISDIIDGGECEIVVGYTHTFKFNYEIPVVNALNISCIDGFASIKADPVNSKEFIIMSSYINNGVALGDKLRICWVASGRSSWDNVPIWKRYLVQAKEQMIARNYNLALLTCEMAFESFIDTILDELLTKKGLTREASHIILESMRITDKVYRLLQHLDGIKFKEYKNINSKWSNLVQKRNKVAHGEIAEITEAEANEAFDTVVRAILFIYLESSL